MSTPTINYCFPSSFQVRTGNTSRLITSPFVNMQSSNFGLGFFEEDGKIKLWKESITNYSLDEKNVNTCE